MLDFAFGKLSRPKRIFCGGFQELNEFLKAAGFRLNQEGGELKISPDGGLLQSSTIADSIHFQFADGEVLCHQRFRSFLSLA